MCKNQVRPTFERAKSCIPNTCAMLRVHSCDEEFIRDDDRGDRNDDDNDDAAVFWSPRDLHGLCFSKHARFTIYFRAA